MCGINGIINKHKLANSHMIKLMNKTIKHRGPDDEGSFVDGNIALGHVRLSILDLSKNGYQPMENDDVVIVYNGEIYNFQHIRKELELDGVKFFSNTDTEVLLKSYCKWGMDFVQKLNGMFAFAIYDKKKGKIFLARDRFGVKPLYIYQDKEQLIFSSEIKAIIQNNLLLTLDTKAISQYLSLLYVPHPSTPYKQIKKLDASCYVEVDLKDFELKKNQYWSFKKRTLSTKKTNTLKTLEEMLQESVKLRMISDVEVGSFLSGGVDSSLITAIASKYTNHRLKTFSIGYKGLSDYFDETKYALKVSKKYNTNHTVLNIDFNHAFDDLKDMIYYMDEPIADTSMFLNFHLARLTKEHVSVALSGLGGDEIFGGYNRYQAMIIISKIKLMPKFMQKSFINFIMKFKENRISKFGNQIRQIKKLLISMDENLSKTYENIINYNRLNLSYKPDMHKKFDLNGVLKFDIAYYMQDDLLNLSDKMTMAHSLEMRVPFLDYKFLSYGLSLDQSQKTTMFKKKILLKKLALKYLDRDIVYRKKQGFSAPVEIWLNLMGEKKIKQMIDFAFVSKFLDIKFIYEDLHEFFVLKKDKSLQIYSYIVLSIWYKINKQYITNEDLWYR